MTRYSITAFFPILSEEFGWSRSLIGTAQSISLWVYSFFSILTGLMIDRIGGRKTMSHFTTIQTQIRDIAALREACRELGVELVENTQARGYSSTRRRTW